MLRCSAGGAAQRAQRGLRQQAGGRVEQRRDAVRHAVLLLPLRPAGGPGRPARLRQDHAAHLQGCASGPVLCSLVCGVGRNIVFAEPPMRLCQMLHKSKGILHSLLVLAGGGMGSACIPKGRASVCIQPSIPYCHASFKGEWVDLPCCVHSGLRVAGEQACIGGVQGHPVAHPGGGPGKADQHQGDTGELLHTLCGSMCAEMLCSTSTRDRPTKRRSSRAWACAVRTGPF